MEMRAVEDIAIGEDLTPPLSPLATVLHDSSVTSYCSACSSSLPTQPIPPSTLTVPSNIPNPLYCSPDCCSIDSSLHFSSAEHHILSLFNHSAPAAWTDSSDLRLSLRLLHIFQKFPTKYSMENVERIGGLMTNREKLLFANNMSNQFEENRRDCVESVENMEHKIREGAKMMAKARRLCANEDDSVEKHDDFVVEEMMLCLVMTNAVEVQDEHGITIGIAIYDAAFSWINHSCSPNACYRFVQGKDHNVQVPFRITSHPANSLISSERNGYGPRVIVRSITAINRGEEVTIAYTDLLQPREARKAELWLKYRFSCSCKRCSAVPTAYVDYVLRALSVDNCDLEDETEKLMEMFDDAINEYLSSSDPKSCCKKLENLLIHGEVKEAKSPQRVILHLFHHLSLNAYMILASAFRVQASDLMALNHANEQHKLEAFKLCKTSCAYSLLLAGATNHLFMFESSLLATLAHFWVNAGKSLLDLVRSFLKPGLVPFKPIPHTPDQNFEETKNSLYNCIADLAPEVWRVLACESNFLKLIQNPFDMSWLASPLISGVGYSEFEGEECGDELRMNLIQLSIHCLRYGTILSSICYGLSGEITNLSIS